MNPTLPVPNLLDRALDGSVVLGFSKIGAAARSLRPIEDRMEGRKVVITGATGGIGRSTAVGLARLGAEVILVGRSESKLAEAARASEAAGGVARIERADLSLMREVVLLSDRITERHGAIDVLVNNVGVLNPTRLETAEGLEATLATNLLGQFILTNRLIEALRAAAETARVITVSSGGMYTTRLSASDLQSTGTYKGTMAYARTKRAQVALTEMWAERHALDGIVFHSMHPGWADTPGVTESLPGFARVAGPILRSPEQGADTILWLAASPEPLSSSGVFWHDRAPRPTHRLRSTVERSGERNRLWSALEEMQRRFEISTQTTR